MATITESKTATELSGSSPVRVFGPEGSACRHLLSVADFTPADLRTVLDLAVAVRAGGAGGVAGGALPLSGQTAVLLFEKPSLRTRVSFESGIVRLGGHPMFFDHGGSRIGTRESLKDYAKNLERFVSIIVARVHDHATLAGLAEHASVPVINALSDVEHPCQAIADMLTLRDALGTLEGARLAWVGDGNNVCHSLLIAAASLGVDMTVVTPQGFEPRFEVIRSASRIAEGTGATLTVGHDLESIAGHHAVYTDTWVSMGNDGQKELRRARFSGLQVDGEVMATASRGLGKPAIFMHCLPAHRGEEVTDAVIDSPASVVYDQAENRMHAQNAILMHLLGLGIESAGP